MKLVNTTGGLDKRYSWKEIIKMFKDAGFDGYDLNIQVSRETKDEIHSDEYRKKIEELKAYADEIGIECTQIHAPFGGVQEELKDAIIRSLEYGAYLGAKIAVVHPTIDNNFYYENREKLFEENIAFYKELLPYAENYGIKIACENMYGWDRERHINTGNVCSHSEEFKRYVDAVGSPYLIACVDIGHCQLVHEAPENMIRELGDRVCAIHVHDNTGYDDAHNIPYSGTINWDGVCKALADIDYKGNFTFESGRFFTPQMDDEHIKCAIKYLEQVGRSLIRKIHN